MTDNSKTDRKYFTVERANAMLPLVRAIVKDLAELSRDVIDRRDRLAHLLAGRNGQTTDVYSEELVQIEEELEKDGRRLRDYVEELTKLGLEPKNGQEGLVDFPTLIDGREAYLCWKLDEAEVLYWHELDGGFAGRQALTAGAGVDLGGINPSGGDMLGH
ncbi:MAG TPA: DUF2203 domain-containing protein [Pirellulales bacterium]|jgi:hypothetical protein